VSGDDELVLVGQGPVATVYAGEADDTAFALKVYPGALDRRSLRAVRTEIAALAGLREQAHILAPDTIERLPDGNTALRMDLCAQSLGELVDQEGAQPVGEVLALGESLALALSAAHGRGIVHGGVSPGNVLFEGSGDVLLSDFGTTLRRYFADATTPQPWTAPETLRDGSLDERCDLYGLGAILHVALTGRPPHRRVPGEPDDRFVLRVLTDPVPPIDRTDVPPALANLVAGLLAKDPTDRPGSAQEVVDRLRAVRENPTRAHDPGHGTPVSPLPDDLGEPILVTGPARRRRRLPTVSPAPVVAAVVVVAMLVVGAVLLLAYRPQQVAVPPAPAEIRGANPTTSAAVENIRLDQPVDLGHSVELSWHGDGNLHYAVIVAEEGGETDTVYVNSRTSYRVEVDPSLAYCFQVKGSDGVRVYTSEIRPLRRAACSP
jgi:hypothetical protein